MPTTRFTTPPEPGGPSNSNNSSENLQVERTDELDITALDTLILAIPALPQRREWLLTWAAGHDVRARAATRRATDINLDIEDGERTLSRHYDAWVRLRGYSLPSARDTAELRWRGEQLALIERGLGEMRQAWMHERNLATRHTEAARRLRAEAAAS